MYSRLKSTINDRFEMGVCTHLISKCNVVNWVLFVPSLISRYLTKTIFKTYECGIRTLSHCHLIRGWKGKCHIWLEEDEQKYCIRPKIDRTVFEFFNRFPGRSSTKRLPSQIEVWTVICKNSYLSVYPRRGFHVDPRRGFHRNSPEGSDRWSTSRDTNVYTCPFPHSKHPSTLTKSVYYVFSTIVSV